MRQPFGDDTGDEHHEELGDDHDQPRPRLGIAELPTHPARDARCVHDYGRGRDELIADVLDPLRERLQETGSEGFRCRLLGLLLRRDQRLELIDQLLALPLILERLNERLEILGFHRLAGRAGLGRRRLLRGGRKRPGARLEQRRSDQKADDQEEARRPRRIGHYPRSPACNLTER